MFGWLTKRLTPFRLENDRWRELAEACETFWQDLFYIEFDKVVALRSIYTADEAGQLLIVKEMGGYYEQALTESNRQMAIALRRGEVHQKETFVPMARALQRVGIDASAWVPLYILEGDAYLPENCYTEYELSALGISVERPELKLDGSWLLDGSKTLPVEVGMTSRGVIELDITEGAPILDVVIDRVMQTKPLHIVFDGYRLGFSAAAGDIVKTDFFMGFIAEYELYYPFNATVLKNGDDYGEYAFSWAGMVAEEIPVPVYVGFGDGGHTGEIANVEDSSLTGLVHELLRVPIFGSTVIDAATLEVVARVPALALNGEIISEVGFYDVFGQFIGVKNFAPMVKKAGSVVNYALRFTEL